MLGKLAIPEAAGVLLLSALFSNPISAQSPYQGTWSGDWTYRSVSTCTSAGPGGSMTYNEVCGGVAPWIGNVNANGRFTVFRSPSSSFCSTDASQSVPNYFSSPTDAAPFSYGVIDASGMITVPAVTVNRTLGTTTVVSQCPSTVFQFTGTTVSDSISCPQTSHDVRGNPSVTTDCSGINTSSWTGTEGPAILAAPAVIFPMNVSTNITTAAASATAQVSPPPAQVGTTASVYVFAHARLSALHGAKRGMVATGKDGALPDPCVLAQLNSNGQLTATSGSTMQAYTTGVLSSQSQSVTILNNVPTSNVAGATFMVGYGTSASNMLASGNYEGAVSVTGPSPCSAALLASAAPNAPAALSGLWWNPNEPGWGISFTQRRNVVFGAWYTYDSTGKPKWYVASNCALPAGVTGTTGSCTGSLYQVTGPTFFGGNFNPSLDTVTSVGTLSVNFAGANQASMTYSVNGQGRTVSIVRQSFQAGATAPAVDYTDLWWNPGESGWGAVITQQYGVIFLAWYVYDAGGNPVWYVAPDCVLSGSSCSGTVYATTGPPLGPSFDPNAVHATAVGSVVVNFSDANNASLSYNVNGTTGLKQITRQTF
jgi:hypothetical protein